MPNTKKYILTAITLGVIGAASAAIIGVTNMITRDKIAQNEVDKVNAGITEIFGQNTAILEEHTAEEAGLKTEYKYVSYLYDVKDSNGNNIGTAFKTSGSNMYGKITLLVGYLKEDITFSGVSIITNEQTYATTLVDNYINPLNGGTRDVDDVSCGATYGAKLVRDMVNEAYEASVEYWG